MRVCHLCSSTLDGHYFANLGRGLVANGVSLWCGSLWERETPSWILQSPAASHFFLNARARSRYPVAVAQLAELLRRERIDILQTHLFDAALIGILASRLARTPVTVLTRHHTDEIWLAGTRWHVALDCWTARAADHVVVLSQAVRNHMITREHLTECDIEVIYQGFDFEALTATPNDRRRVRAEFGLQDDFVIGCVARFFKTKGHEYLLAALRDLVKAIPNVRLLLLGTGERKMIDAIIRDYHLEGRVIFAGYRRDVPACLRAMDVVVHPSLSEAFCQALIETMAAGTALVTTNVAGAPEVVTDGESGVLIPPADPTAIAHAVLALYRDPERRQRLAAEGQRSVRDRFTIEKMVGAQMNCYRRWLNGCR